MLLMSLAMPAAERKPPAPGAVPMPPRSMVEECSREFGQIAGTSLPFADPPTKENMMSKRSAVNPTKPYGINVADGFGVLVARESLDHSGHCRANGRLILADGGTVPEGFRPATSHT